MIVLNLMNSNQLQNYLTAIDLLWLFIFHVALFYIILLQKVTEINKINNIFMSMD